MSQQSRTAASGVDARGSTDLERFLKMDARIERVSHKNLKAMSQLQQSIEMAECIEELRGALTDRVMHQVVLPLMNTALGFRTDRPNKRDPEPYGLEEVRECVLEALIRGARLVGNEFNIISGRAYLTKEYFTRAIAEFPGLTNFVLNLGVPIAKNGGSIVPFEASWQLDGVPVRVAREIPVKVNEYMGADAILGKAERKARAACFNVMAGSVFVAVDGEVDGDRGSTDAAKTASAMTARIDALPATDTPRAATAAADPDPQPKPTSAGPSGTGERAAKDAPAGKAEPADKGGKAVSDDEFLKDLDLDLLRTAPQAPGARRGRGPNASTVDITVGKE